MTQTKYVQLSALKKISGFSLAVWHVRIRGFLWQKINEAAFT